MRLAKDVRTVTRIHPTWHAQYAPVPIFDRSKPLIRVCQVCKRQLEGASNHPIGEPLPAGPNQSHGICTEDVREWAEDLGLPQVAVEELVWKCVTEGAQ